MIQLIFFSVGCSSSRYPTTQTIVTEYGEVFEIEIDYSRNFHHQFLDYVIRGDNDKRTMIIARFWPQEELPEDPFALLECISQTEYINFYRIQDVIIFSGQAYIDAITAKALTDLKDYRQSELSLLDGNPEKQTAFLETFEKVPEAFVETRQLRYMQYSVPYLLEEQNLSCVPLIERWASGDISEEEIAINNADGYTKNDLIDWARQFDISEYRLS